MNRIVYTSLLLALLALLGGCCSTSEPEIPTVKLSQTTLTLSVGQTATLSYTLEPASVTSKEVVWSTSSDKVATVTAEGLVTAVGPGVATITVTHKASGVKAEAKVTVTKDSSVNDINGMKL